MIKSRRKARTVALQALYESDCVGHELLDVVRRLAEEESLPEENVEFTLELAQGVLEKREEIDGLIQRFAPNFPVDQLPLVDRAILRLAICELLSDRKLSVKVIINEAVELAKSFGGESSPRFINGVLGSVSALLMQK